MPLAGLVLVFDGFGLPGRALLGGGAPRRVERLRVRRKALRKGAVYRVSSAIFVADDFVGDVCHRLTCLLQLLGIRNTVFKVRVRIVSGAIAARTPSRSGASLTIPQVLCG